jgi:hypothetical protein
MATRIRRGLCIAATVVLGAVLIVIFASKDVETVKWLSEPPAGGPPRFAFLGNKWGWKVNGWWLGLTRRTPVDVALTAHVFEFNSLSSVSNLSPALRQATNQSGDQVWIFAAHQDPMPTMQTGIGMKEVATSSMSWLARNQAQMAWTETVPAGFSNQTVTVGRWLDLWVDRTDKNSSRLTFFSRDTQQDRTKLRWLNESELEIGVHTNSWFGAAVSVPMNGSLLVISGRTNLQGKHVGVHLSPTFPRGRIWQTGN